MSWLTSLLIGYLILVGLMFLLQRTLLYPGAKERPSRARYEASDYREVTTQTEDGLELGHWYLEPAVEGNPVVVVFHGNGGHFGHRAPKFKALAEAGYGLFLASYRGYGGNPGRPSEDGLSADARSVLKWLEDSGVASSRVVIYGESLGSAVAVRMKCRTGAVQRMISSTALAIISGSSARAASWSGCSTRACMPPAMADEVVSWPAVATMT